MNDEEILLKYNKNQRAIRKIEDEIMEIVIDEIIEIGQKGVCSKEEFEFFHQNVSAICFSKTEYINANDKESFIKGYSFIKEYSNIEKRDFSCSPMRNLINILLEEDEKKAEELETRLSKYGENYYILGRKSKMNLSLEQRYERIKELGKKIEIEWEMGRETREKYKKIQKKNTKKEYEKRIKEEGKIEEKRYVKIKKDMSGLSEIERLRYIVNGKYNLSQFSKDIVEFKSEKNLAEELNKLEAKKAKKEFYEAIEKDVLGMSELERLRYIINSEDDISKLPDSVTIFNDGKYNIKKYPENFIKSDVKIINELNDEEMIVFNEKLEQLDLYSGRAKMIEHLLELPEIDRIKKIINSTYNINYYPEHFAKFNIKIINELNDDEIIKFNNKLKYAEKKEWKKVKKNICEIK